MKSTKSVLRVPSTVPVFSISVVLVTGSFFVAMIFTLGIRLLSFPADVVHLVVLVSCLSLWMTVSVVPAPVLDMQSAILVIGHFTSFLVVLQLVPLSRCQVRCYRDAVLSEFFPEATVPEN